MSQIKDSYPHPVRLAFIGGSGLPRVPGFEIVAQVRPKTPWGFPSSCIAILRHREHPNTQGKDDLINPSSSSSSVTGSTKDENAFEFAFLFRHDEHHTFAPHEVPYRANIAALRSLGVRCIIAFSAVGSLDDKFRPLDFLVPHQLIDFTKGLRPCTFFENGVVGHVSMNDPFDHYLGRVVRQCGKKFTPMTDMKIHDRGVVVCIEGPQFSTRFESGLFRSWGAQVINMTCIPEAKLAREAEIAYCLVCMATDYDNWKVENEIDGSSTDVNVKLVMTNMESNGTTARLLILQLLQELKKPTHHELLNASHLAGTVRSSIMTPDGYQGQQARENISYLYPDYYKKL